MQDKNGKLISVGDHVVLSGVVLERLSRRDGSFCSVRVGLDGDWDGKGNTDATWFSAKQLEVVEDK